MLDETRVDPNRSGRHCAPRRPAFGARLALGHRLVLVLATAGVLTVAAQLPAAFVDPFFVGVNTLVVLSFAGLGYYLAVQHGERFTGACLVVAGAGWVVHVLDVHPGWGPLASWLLGGPVLYTALGWGILRCGRAELDAAGRRWVATCLVATLGTAVAGALVARPQWLGFAPAALWPAPWPDATATALLLVLGGLAWLAVAGCFALVAVRALRAALPAQRRLLRPLVLAGAGWGATVLVVAVAGVLAPELISRHAGTIVVGLIWIKVNIAVAASANRSRMLAATFVETLPRERTPETLTGYVRTALSDPTAELLFVVPGREFLIDGSGRPRELPDQAGGSRFVHWIVGTAGERVAVLVGDPVLREDMAAVRSFAGVLSIVAENQQLHAVLRMRLAQLGAVRAAERMAYERAREQFRRDLHDGVQQTIAAARIDLEDIRDEPASSAGLVTAELDGKLRLALDQIRSLKRGGPPPELSRGLATAVDRTISELRMPATCRIARDDLGVLTLPVYYLVREALTNAHKHAGPADTEVVVEQSGGYVDVMVRDTGAGGASVRPGGGLAGLRDRVAELGGTLEVRSPPGGGTTLRALIPAVPA